MKTSYQANWEDEENSRQVELVVNYRLDQTRVDLSDVTPTRVNFLCSKSAKQLRSVGVHTATGRKLLARQIEAAGRLATLPQEIAAGRLVEIKHAAPRVRADHQRVLQA
jgi:hypothetical protein